MANFDPHKNFAYSTVATAPSPALSGTTLVLATGFGTLFPDPGTRGYNVSVWPAGAAPISTNAEIVRVIAKSSDTLTIVRAQEGSTARTILVGDQIANTITVKVLTDIEAAISYDAIKSHGADIASAATLNLDSATGDLIDVTGSTTITAVTLSDGRQRMVRFTGTPAVAHNGTTLILQGGGSGWIAAPGDIAIFRGYAAGVVRGVFFPISGKALVDANSYQGQVGATNFIPVCINGSESAGFPFVNSQISDDGTDIAISPIGKVDITPSASGATTGAVNITPSGDGDVNISPVIGDVNIVPVLGDVNITTPGLVNILATDVVTVAPVRGASILLTVDLAQIILTGIPTSDPSVSGAIWRDAITNLLHISP